MKIKGLTPILLIVLVVLFVTGHADFLKGPLTDFMHWSETAIGGVNAVGWSIIILTLLVRLILLPMMIHQQRNATIQQEKMRLLQPQLKKVQEAQKGAQTQEEQMLASQAMMTIYRENNVSLLGGMNFATLIIQWPVFMGLYAAIRNSNEIAHATFLGINLSSHAPILAIATAVAYGIQAYLSLIGIPAEQKKQMQMMMYVMPIMMLFMTWVTNAGIALYFFAGALVMILQTLIIIVWRPRLKAQVNATFEVKDVVDDALAGKIKAKPSGRFAEAMQAAQEQQKQQQQNGDRKDITDTTQEHNGPKGGRNAGKQNRK
ncbi:membrane protein insertase YidC [Weissella bombi]|uniref:YidC/Oxa1 family membrane protein insertase n=1 Tax=Weissella bombi TaxID=1505725 RepID=A0A1C3YVI4_9LACO|nr:membrane protein insertase YidC [Weissella bombi]SCB74079.1 YidC/Oxa1 family membrane protein insertase [Weissella bombi]